MVADRGRGGFDSHTFPPVAPARPRPLALDVAFAFAFAFAFACAVAISGAAPGAWAQDLVPGGPTTTRGGAEPDTLRGPGGERARPWHRQPWAVMTRSVAVPGWGQLHNGRPLKAALAVAAEAAFAWQVADAWRDLDRALADERRALRAGDADAAARFHQEYDDAYARRSNAAWWLAAAVGLAMADAYVDAHFLQFDADFGPDPGLSGESASPRGDTGSRARVGARVGVRVAFAGP